MIVIFLPFQLLATSYHKPCTHSKGTRRLSLTYFEIDFLIHFKYPDFMM